MSSIFESFNDSLKMSKTVDENILDGLDVPKNIRNSYEKDLKGYIKELNEVADSGKKASAGIDGFNDYLAKNGQQTIKSTTVMQDFKNGIKSFGKTALSMATNAGIDLLISGAFQLGAWGIDKVINAQSDAKVANIKWGKVLQDAKPIL